MAGLPLQAHPDHTCQSTDIQCILQYIALAQDVSVLTLGLQLQQALCRCSGASWDANFKKKSKLWWGLENTTKTIKHKINPTPRTRLN